MSFYKAAGAVLLLFGGEIEYQIVGSNEANPLLGKISDQSPIGQALIGKRGGDEVSVEAPGGIVHLKVLEVSRVHHSI
jgi:transcription elongation factor GreA